MNTFRFGLCAGVLLCGLAASAETPGTAERLSNVGGAASDVVSEKAIRKLYDNFAATWNRHDAPALADMWTIDGDHAEPDGTHVNGHQAVAELLKKQHETIFKNTTLTLSIVDVWFITADVALVDGSYELSGARTPDGKELPARKGFLTAVLLKEKDRWWITASRLMIPTALPYKK